MGESSVPGAVGRWGHIDGAHNHDAVAVEPEPVQGPTCSICGVALRSVKPDHVPGPTLEFIDSEQRPDSDHQHRHPVDEGSA